MHIHIFEAFEAAYKRVTKTMDDSDPYAHFHKDNLNNL